MRKIAWGSCVFIMLHRWEITLALHSLWLGCQEENVRIANRRVSPLQAFSPGLVLGVRGRRFRGTPVSAQLLLCVMGKRTNFCVREMQVVPDKLSHWGGSSLISLVSWLSYSWDHQKQKPKWSMLSTGLDRCHEQLGTAAGTIKVPKIESMNMLQGTW